MPPPTMMTRGGEERIEDGDGDGGGDEEWAGRLRHALPRMAKKEDDSERRWLAHSQVWRSLPAGGQRLNRNREWSSGTMWARRG